MTPWAWLLIAAAFEVVWSQSIKPTDGFSRPLPTLLCFVLGASAVYFLSRAMRELPVGPSYVVFTGLGAVGAVVLGMLVSGDAFSATRLVGVALVVAGVAVCHLA